MMIKVEAYVREDKFEDVKAALNAIGVNGLTVSQVMGCGIQRGYKEIVRGMQVDMQMQPKIKFEIVVLYYQRYHYKESQYEQHSHDDNKPHTSYSF